MAALGMYALGLAFCAAGLGLLVASALPRSVGAPGGVAGRAVVQHDARTAAAGAAFMLLVGVLLVALDPGSYMPVHVGGLWSARWAAVLGPAIAGIGILGYLGVHAVGELTWPRPSGTRRQARLRARVVADVAPAGLRRLPAVWAAGTVVAAVVFGLAASGPTTISRLIAPGVAHTVTGFPGWKFGLPMIVVAVVVVAAGERILELIASRPAVEGIDEAQDMTLRQRTAGRVLRVEQFVLAAALAGFAGAGGVSVRALGLARAGDGAGTAHIPSSPVHQWAGAITMLAALVVFVVGSFAALRFDLPSRTLATASAHSTAEGAR